MIAEPFLLNEDCSVFIDNDTSGYGADLISAAGVHQQPGGLNVTETGLFPAKSLAEAQQMTRVRFAFWIMAAVMVGASSERFSRQILELCSRFPNAYSCTQPKTLCRHKMQRFNCDNLILLKVQKNHSKLHVL